jgi:CelD/BcsL family acetyltransferase involved in cellulose biosynthesis
VVHQPLRSPQPAPACRAEFVTDRGAFVALEPAWNALTEEAGLDHPFLSHAWVRTWWDCFGAGSELQIVVVRAGKDLIAIAPLMLGRVRLYGLPVRQLAAISNDHTPRFEFIVARRADEAYREIWRLLAAHRDRWDVLKLYPLPDGSRTLTDLPAPAVEHGFLTGTWRAEDSPYVPLGGGWERYFMSLSHNHRAQMRKRLRRLARVGTVDLETVSSADGLDGALEDGLRMEAVAWKTRAGSAILCHPSVTRFYTDLARATARGGSLRLTFLRVGGLRIAFAFALCHANRLYVLKSGYDASYADYSPYNLLCYLVLQDACRLGLDEYDFLGGSEEWKLHWTNERRGHRWLYILPGTLAGRFLHWAKFRVAPRLRVLG